MDRTLIMLGCGTSVGVPMIGCECHVCTGGHPKNQRTRSSVLFQLPAGNLLIDSSPELRLQLLREKIPIVHSIVFTHYHVDHLFGLDDVRLFPRRLGGPLPVYCTQDVEEVIRRTFSYAFTPESLGLPLGMLPRLDFQRIGTNAFQVLQETLVPIPLKHAQFDVLGFRIGDLAYCTDVSHIPETSWPLLEGLDVLVLDALRPSARHPSHLSLEQAVDVARRVKAKRLVLTHMSHEMDYESINIPPNVELGFDGMRIEF